MLQEIYFREVSRALRYLPAWMPNAKVELGDIIDRTTLERKSNIRSVAGVGVTFATRDASTRASFEYSTARGVSISAKVAGRIAPGSSLGRAEAGMIVKFSQENAVVFEASGCTGSAIEDLVTLGSRVLALSRARPDDWNDDWVVVTEVVRARCATVLISGDRSAQIDLKANGALAPAGIALADPNARLAAKEFRDIAFRCIAETDLTPLYRAFAIKRGFFGRRVVSGSRALVAPPREAAPEEQFAEVSADDFFTATADGPA